MARSKHDVATVCSVGRPRLAPPFHLFSLETNDAAPEHGGIRRAFARGLHGKPRKNKYSAASTRIIKRCAVRRGGPRTRYRGAHQGFELDVPDRRGLLEVNGAAPRSYGIEPAD